MTRVGFTGSRRARMTLLQLRTFFVLLSELRDIGPAPEFHHGCCISRDDQAARIAKCLGYRLFGHPPTKQDFIGTVKNDFDYPKLSYLERNHRIVDATQLLLAAPLTNYEQIRSGTWATVRFAVRRKKPGFVIWPSGELTPLARAVACCA